jgi:hypothetical protein
MFPYPILRTYSFTSILGFAKDQMDFRDRMLRRFQDVQINEEGPLRPDAAVVSDVMFVSFPPTFVGC